MNNQSKKLLFDVLTACQEIISFLDGKTHDDYVKDVLLRRGVETETSRPVPGSPNFRQRQNSPPASSFMVLQAFRMSDRHSP